MRRQYQHMQRFALTARSITQYGSRGLTSTRTALREVSDGFGVSVSSYSPGGVAGRHPAALWQVFAVVLGSGWVSDSAGERQSIAAGQAVVWEPGELHESGSDQGMTAVITESVEPPLDFTRTKA